MADFIRRAAVDGRTMLQHIKGIGFRILDAGDFSKFQTNLAVRFRCCRRFEKERIRANGRKEQACILRRQGNTIFLGQFGNNGRAAAQRFNAHIKGCSRLQAAQAMVIDDFL